MILFLKIWTRSDYLVITVKSQFTVLTNFELKGSRFSFQLDFLFYKNQTFAKIISSDSIIKDWALQFIKLRRYFRMNNSPIQLWVIYNDKEGVKAKDINKLFGPDMEDSFGWYSDRERLVTLIK